MYMYYNKSQASKYQVVLSERRLVLGKSDEPAGIVVMITFYTTL